VRKGADGKEMVYVPAGEFIMGDDSDPWASPAGTIKLDEFWIDRLPVTVAEFARFVRETGYQTDAEKANAPTIWNSGGISATADLPVVFVSWYDAAAYCLWAGNARLPTEARWEKAARGTDGRLYPWGNLFDARLANTAESQIGRATSVGSYPAGVSPYGALDMAGNVWEWTNTRWGKRFAEPDYLYPYTPDDGREKIGEDYLRVLRGGSWFNDAAAARTTARFRASPYAYLANVGFRCVK